MRDTVIRISMNKFEIHQLQTEYVNQLHRQELDKKGLDYALFEKHKPSLVTLSAIGNTGISVFDFFMKDHLFYSPNYSSVLGYNPEEILEKGQIFLDKKIHPDDHIILMKNGILLLSLFHHFPIEEKADYKLINEYRILNADGKYVRVIEQHQVLELDRFGNTWLSLSIIDISPNQDITEAVKSQLLNFKTGQIIPFLQESEKSGQDLTQRELEILELVKDGYLSKEISSKLSISVHTVNTHRQRVLEKLGANNSMEAVVFASRSGLLT